MKLLVELIYQARHSHAAQEVLGCSFAFPFIPLPPELPKLPAQTD